MDLDLPPNASRKQAEEQCQFQATILRYVTDSVIVTDLQSIITYWNEGAYAVFGYSAQEMIGKSTALLCPEIDEVQFTYNRQRILAGDDYVGAWQGRRKDGTTLWADVKTTVLRDTQGTAIGLIGIAKDITSRKQAEESLRQSEKHFRALVENITDGFVLTDAHGIITYVSPSTTRIVGFLPEEFIGRRVFRMVYPADQEATRRLCARVLEEPGKSQRLEYRTKRKDGTFLWIDVVGLNLLHEPGVEAVVWNFRDVTERKQMEQEVTRAKEQLEAILHNVADGILVVDSGGRIVYVNKVAASTFGFPSAEALLAAPRPSLGRLFSRVPAWDERGRPLPFEERPSVQALHGKKVQALLQYQDALTTSQRHWILVSAQPIVDAQGQVQFVVSVFTDLTEQKELEQRKDHFISMASHELKTPLTILSAHTQLLREWFEVEDRQDAVLHLSKMDDQITNLTKLVVDLLDISKMQAGQLELAQEAVDMNELVHEVVENLQPTTTHHLRIEGAAQQAIIGDKNRLGQVLIILLNNAIKYSPHTDTVAVRVTRTLDMLTVSVQDFGIGIAQSHQQRLFERFYRVLSKKDQTYPGLGIGLYIAHEIIQRHGGKIWVESVEGSGSTFFFSLPLLSSCQSTSAPTD